MDSSTAVTRSETALKTPTPGAASETCEPVLENDARAPCRFEAATESPRPPTPFEPTGCSSAAGYSTSFPLQVAVADGGDEERSLRDRVVDRAPLDRRASSIRRG